MAVIPVRPSLALLFDRADFNDQIITTSRSSVATAWTPEGGLKEFAIDEPRLDYDPVTGELKGLLIEGSRSNLIEHSEALNSSYWIKTQCSITSNDIIAPDGNSTADKLVVDNGFGVGVIQASAGTLGAGAYAVSFFAKADEFDTCYFRYSNSQEIRIDFDLSAKTATRNVAGSSIVEDDAGIIDVGGGRYRCYVVFTTSASRIFDYRIGTTNTGNGSDGIHIWGAQLEAGSDVSSYIKTSGASATRSADDYKVEGEAFTDFFNTEEGTIVLEAYLKFKTLGGAGIVTFRNSDASDRFQIFATTNNEIVFRNRVSGVNEVDETPYSGLSEGWYKFAFNYSGSTMKITKNGESVMSYSGYVKPNLTALDIGGILSINKLNGHIKRILYYPKALTDAQCILLTKTLSL